MENTPHSSHTGSGGRPPAVAGLFYPERPEELSHTVLDLLEHSHCHISSQPKALIVPHAGYRYSGPIAANAYACLEPYKSSIEKVVLFGPDHKIGFHGMALPEWESFSTPLGEIPIDQANVRKLEQLPDISQSNLAHAYEHSLEVQLPFLQTILDLFELTPVVVSNAKPQSVAKALQTVWGGAETLILISSDLSHYHPYEEARVRDASTTHAIETLDTSSLSGEKACGYQPVSGLLEVAKATGLKEQTLDVRNSGDTSGMRDQVVGYGAYAFTQT